MGNRATVAAAAVSGLTIGVGGVATIYNAAAHAAPMYVYSGLAAALLGFIGVVLALVAVS